MAVDGVKQGATKKQLQVGTGRLKLCKAEFFENFLNVLKEYNISLRDINNPDDLSYKEAKLAAKDYQKQWEKLKTSFKIWTKKSDDLLQFKGMHLIDKQQFRF